MKINKNKKIVAVKVKEEGKTKDKEDTANRVEILHEWGEKHKKSRVYTNNLQKAIATHNKRVRNWREIKETKVRREMEWVKDHHKIYSYIGIRIYI